MRLDRTENMLPQESNYNKNKIKKKNVAYIYFNNNKKIIIDITTNLKKKKSKSYPPILFQFDLFEIEEIVVNQIRYF